MMIAHSLIYRVQDVHSIDPDSQVIPATDRDSMLLNLGGTQPDYFEASLFKFGAVI
jgi:hypothetical protein